MKLLAVLAAALAAAAADVDETKFAYSRALEAPAGAPAVFEPDGALYGHTREGFPDLRVLDADGEQVPWRPAPTAEAVPSQPVELAARGRRGSVVSVVLDRGPAGPAIDRIELEIPDRTFVGSVVVQGSMTGEEGSYARLSWTTIYSIRGAVDARSTAAVFPPTDYRFFLVQARGVSDITRASVARDPGQAPLERVTAKSDRRNGERTTIVTLDLRFPGVPVDAVRLRSTTSRYVRRVTIDGSDNGNTFQRLTEGEIARFEAVDLSRIRLSARSRFLRVTIRNGDDEPLAALRVRAEAAARPLLLASGYRVPYRLLYGSAPVEAPAYDFAQLPASATGIERARTGTLGTEEANQLFELPADTRTFFERNDSLIQVALVLAALVVAAGGFLALRRRT